MNLIVVNGKGYQSDFRKYLMRAAVQSGGKAVHLCCLTEILVPQDDGETASYPAAAPYDKSAR